MFSRLRSGATIATIVAIPTALCFMMLAKLLLSQIGALRTSAELLEQIALAERFGTLVHAMQKERGASAGFIGSGGVAFGDALPGLRQDVDAHRERLEQTLDTIALDALPETMAREITFLRRQLTQLDDARTRVDTLNVAMGEHVAYYTGMIRSQLSAVKRLASTTSSAETALDLVGYAAVMEAKERMGILRATGAAGFGRGEFTQGEWRRLISLVSQRQAFDIMFDGFASEDAVLRRNALVEGPAERRVREMLTYALDAGPGTAVDRYSGPEWFAATTAVIDDLHALEVDAIVTARSATESGRANTFLMIAVMYGPFVVLVIVAASITRSAAKSMAGSMSWIARRLRALAEGDIDSPIREGAGNEIGDIARAMLSLCETERAARAERAERARSEADRAEAERVAAADRIADLRAGVGAANEALAALAGGDLTACMQGRFEGEFAELQERIDATVESLRGAVDQIRKADKAISSTAGEAAVEAQDMSKRAESQAATLEEIAAGMETLSQSVRANADQAATAQDGAESARTSAATGAETAQRAVESMRRTEEASTKITEMVAVIEGFAFQTGLLAVNAAVEAARAGESGKGFAVVAQEVRSLADRSSAAARDVAEVVAAANARASETVRLVEEAGESLTAVSASITGLAGAVDQIAAASRDQADEVETVARATAGLQRATGEAATVAERSAKVAAALDSEAANLGDAIARFSTGATKREAA